LKREKREERRGGRGETSRGKQTRAQTRREESRGEERKREERRGGIRYIEVERFPARVEVVLDHLRLSDHNWLK